MWGYFAKVSNMRRKLVAGNWKMNGSLAANAALIGQIRAGLSSLGEDVDVAVCVPAPYLAQVQSEILGSMLALGAQDVSAHAKVRAALQAGLVPVICVGETLAEREAGRTAEVVRRQLGAVLAVLAPAELENIVVAYEPVWAIGTGKTATPAMAQEVHAQLRAQLTQKDAVWGGRVQLLYGGSMKPDNAKALLAQPDIDGGLIGGAALNAFDFLTIVEAAADAV